MTDGSPAYRRIKDYLPHDVIDHEIEYVRGDSIHTQNIDSYWSNLARGEYTEFSTMLARATCRTVPERVRRFRKPP